MKVRTLSRRFILGFGAMLLAVIGSIAYSTISPVGMTILKPGIQPGYVTFGAPDGDAYAINTTRNVRKKWSSPEANTKLGFPRPLPNSNIHPRREPTSPQAG